MASSINVTELSDSELRKKIKELGKDAGPITKTTRPIWEKRLVKLLAEKDGVVQEEPKKDRRKSKSRATAAAAPVVPAPKKTPTRATAKTKTLAMFSSDEEPEEAVLKSIQTSPIGFPSPTVLAEKVVVKKTASSPIKNGGKSQIIPGSPSVNSRRKTLNTSEYSDIRNRTAAPSSITSNNIDQKLVSSRTSKRISEFSDDDFSDSGLKSKVYTSSNMLSSTRIGSDETDFKKTQDDLLFKRPTTIPPNLDPRSTLTRASEINRYSRRNSSPVDKALLNPPKDVSKSKRESIENEIKATLDEVRKSYKAKKPSPLARSSRTLLHSNNKDEPKHKDEETEEDEDDEEHLDDDEEIDVKFAPIFLSLRRFLTNKMLFLSVIIVLLAAIFAGLYYFGDKAEAKLGIGNLKQDNKANLEAAKCLFSYLSKKTGNIACGYDNGNEFVTIEFLEKNVKECFKETAPKSAIKFIKDNFKKEFKFSAGGSIASRIPSKGLWCRVSTALSVIAYRFLVVFAVAFFAVVAYFFIKRRWIADDEETRQMYYYVDKIIDTLKRHHATSSTDKDIPPYLPIPHVRDMLIPLASRKWILISWMSAR